MNDIRFDCPKCRRSLQVDAAWAGRTVLCPHCQQMTAAPLAAAVPPPLPVTSTKRPAAISVFGILNIVFGAMGIMCTPFSMAIVLAKPNALNPSLLYKGWLIAAGGIGMAAAVWLLIAGIGLLQLRSWGRTHSVAYAWFTIVFGIVGMVVNVLSLLTGSMASGPNVAIGYVGGTIGGLIGLVYPVLLLIFMRRGIVIEAFDDAGEKGGEVR